MLIIDGHVHLKLFKDDHNKCEIEVEKLFDCMGRVGIEKACLIPMVMSNSSNGFYPDKEHILFSAEFLTEIITRHPGKFFSMLWINPHLDMHFLKGLVRKYILEGCINGIKIWAEMSADDERLEELAAYLEQHDIPLLFHCFYNSLGALYSESNPSAIAALARKHPKLRIVMAHLRGCQYRGIQDIKQHANVCVDTSGSGPEDGYLEYALKALGPDRIIFGSDYPGRDFAAQMARIDSLALIPEVKKK